MKYLLLLAAVLLIVVYTDAQRPHSTNGPTIYVGTELRLGMPRDVVVARIAEHYRIVKLEGGGGDTWMVQEKSDSPVPTSIGSLGFTNGKLTYAARDWTQGDEDSYSFAQALMGAMQQMEEDGQHSCSFDAPRSRSPKAEINYLRFYCGSKRIEITRFDISSGAGKGRTVQINEVLSSEQRR